MKSPSAGQTGFSVRVAVAAFLAVAPLAGAGEHAPVDLHRPALADLGSGDTLTGDWGGVRTDLARHGFFFDLYSTSAYQDLASGGLKNG